MASTFWLGRYLLPHLASGNGMECSGLCLQKGPSDIHKGSRYTQPPVQNHSKMSAAQWAAIAASEDRHDR